MKIFGTVINKRTGAPVPYASVTLVNQFGQYLNVGTAANAQGAYSLDSSLIYDPNAVVFSSSGFKPVAVDAMLFDGWDGATQIKLEESDSLDNVTITSGKKTGFFIGLLLFGLVLLKKRQ